MTADVEDNYAVAQANEPLDENGRFVHSRVVGRYRDEFVEYSPERFDFMDVSPKMVVSVATAMIPFLENDDANRALMGANMQRQAVPLLRSEAPIVGTGMEYKAGTDSGVCILAEEDGIVMSVDARNIRVQYDSGRVQDFEVIKFLRSNQVHVSTSVLSCQEDRELRRAKFSQTVPLPKTVKLLSVRTLSSAL